MAQPNIHGTALILDDRGVLVTGESGSGKTTLAVSLIREFSARGRFARLVADDQLFVEALAGRLVVFAPRTIAGLAEVRGIGPQPLDHKPSAVVDLIVRLVPEAEVPRLAVPQTETVEGIALPRLDLPARNALGSSLAISGWLKAPPFR